MMRKDAINLTGHKIGMLTVSGFHGRDKNNNILWNCQCSCGVFCIKLGKRLLQKKTTSCGCKREKNLIGQRFGYWLVLKGVKAGRVKKWLCRCVCGVERNVWGNSLAVSKSSSCGCKNLDLTLDRGKIGAFNGTHHLTSHPLYKVHRGMINRCYNVNQRAYRWYGEKGISVCSKWLESFQNFYNWAMENGYTQGLTIERIDSSKSYTPENCEWITQSENTSRAHRNKHTGKIFNGWKCIEKVPFTTQSVFECIKCGRRKQVTGYMVTSGKAACCKCT